MSRKKLREQIGPEDSYRKSPSKPFRPPLRLRSSCERKDVVERRLAALRVDRSERPSGSGPSRTYGFVIARSGCGREMIGAESESRERVDEAREAVRGVERGEEGTEDGGPMSPNVRGRARSRSELEREGLERDGESAERRRLSRPLSFSFSRPRPRGRLGRGVCSGSTTMLGIGEEDAGEGVLLPLYVYRGSTIPISIASSTSTLSSSTSYLQLSTTGRSANVTPPARRERLPVPVPVPLCDGARVRIERGAVARDATEDAAEETDDGRRRCGTGPAGRTELGTAPRAEGW
jgi:hypothetical protein